MQMLNKKILLLIPIVVVAVVLSGMYITAFATSNSTGSSSSKQTTYQVGPEFMGGNAGGFGGGRMRGRCGPNGNVEISAAYNQTVMSIVNSDSDVQNLLTQGYTVQGVMPIIKSVVQGDGTVVTSATNAVVMLVNGTTGRAEVHVDVTNAKVTQIVIMTMTVINKT